MTTVTGEKLLAAALSKFNLDVQLAVDSAVRVTAFKVLDTAVRSIQEESQGRKGPSRQAKGKIHTASKPGDAPNTDTGRLVSSIQVVHNRGEGIAFVGTNLDYGRILEEEANRPWLEPARDKEAPKFAQRITNAVNVQIIKAGR